LNMRAGYLSIVLFILFCGPAAGQAQPTGLAPASAKPGDQITIAGTNLAGINGATVIAAGISTPVAAVNAAAGSVKFNLPAVAAGNYSVTLQPGAIAVPGALTVAAAAPPPAAPTPVIDSIFPATTYPVGDRFGFEINGQHFDPDPTKDEVDIQGQGLITFGARHAVPAGATAPNGTPPVPCEKYPCLEASADGYRLFVFGYPRGHDYQGPLMLRVIVNGTATEWKGPLTLSRLDHRLVVALALAVFALFMYIVYRLVSMGTEEYMVAGRRYSPLAAFLIDKSTDTYSLSKFQLFALSLVAFFGYVYVFLCRVLVQWNFTFPQVPDNYPSLLAISAGTTAAAIGLNATRGGNGGGPVHPGPADFISNGGLVVADRFQFFVWTLIACTGFVALILLQDPATVSGFPDFPSGLLYVMGVSAAGYLGGKAVRNPGPILRQVKPTDPGSGADLTITLLGENLAKDAKFRINGALQQPTGEVKYIQQAQAQTGSATQLDFTLAGAAGFYKGDNVFEVTNPDGVGAQINFTGTPMNIVGTYSVPKAGDTLTLQVTNYREHCSARWLAPGAADPLNISESDVKLVSGTTGTTSSATVKIPASPSVGKGTLTLVTPVGATESTSVDVK
jgi:hypothetical protein